MGKDVIYRLPSYVSPLLLPRAVSFLASGIEQRPIAQGRHLPSPLSRLTALRFLCFIPTHTSVCKSGNGATLALSVPAIPEWRLRRWISVI